MKPPGTLRFWTAIALAACATVPAEAETVWANVGPWRVVQFDEGCMVGSDQGIGRTVSALRVTLVPGNDSLGLMMDNARWNIKQDEVLEVDLTFDGGRSFHSVPAVGTDHGMTMLPRPYIMDKLRTAEAMTIIHKGRILEHFTLAGSDTAIASGLKCLEAVKSRLAAGQK